MSDEIREDTPVETATGDTPDATQADNGVDEKPQLIFDKYKDMDAVQQGLKSGEQKLHEQAAVIKSLEEKTSLKDAITQLAEASAVKNAPPDDSEDKFRAKLAEIAEDYRESPDVAIEKQMALTNAWIADEGRKVKESVMLETSELKKQMTQMQALMGDRDPDYVQNKELVDKLVTSGMPKENAIAWAKTNAPEESRVMPSNMNGTGLREGENKGAYLTKEDRVRMKEEDDLSDEELDFMEADYQARKKRGL